MKNPPSSRLTSAFTLIELLVVISIIAILASLLFTGYPKAMEMVKKVAARNDMGQIVIAVTAYNTEYMCYPALSGTTSSDAAYGLTRSKGNDQIINILRYPPSSQWTDDTTNPQNPRQIKYLTVADAKDQSIPRSGIWNRNNGGNGAWYDPWGCQYVIFMDGDYNSDIDVSDCYKSGMGQPDPATGKMKVPIPVGAASVGLYNSKQKPPFIDVKNPGLDFSVTTHAFDKSNDLISW